MSFGFSASDVYTLAQLALNTYCAWDGACGTYATFTNDLAILQLILQRVEEDVRKPTSVFTRRPEDLAGWETVVRPCREVLIELEGVLTKYKRIGRGDKHGSQRHNWQSVRKHWDRLRMGSHSFDDLHRKLTKANTSLTAYLSVLGFSSQIRLENSLLPVILERIDGIAEQMRRGNSTIRTTMTTYSSDDKGVWREFRRDLIDKGVNSSAIRQYSVALKTYILRLHREGLLDEDTGETDSSSEESEQEGRPVLDRSASPTAIDEASVTIEEAESLPDATLDLDLDGEQAGYVTRSEPDTDVASESDTTDDELGPAQDQVDNESKKVPEEIVNTEATSSYAMLDCPDRLRTRLAITDASAAYSQEVTKDDESEAQRFPGRRATATSMQPGKRHAEYAYSRPYRHRRDVFDDYSCHTSGNTCLALVLYGCKETDSRPTYEDHKLQRPLLAIDDRPWDERSAGAGRPCVADSNNYEHPAYRRLPSYSAILWQLRHAPHYRPPLDGTHHYYDHPQAMKIELNNSLPGTLSPSSWRQRWGRQPCTILVEDPKNPGFQTLERTLGIELVTMPDRIFYVDLLGHVRFVHHHGITGFALWASVSAAGAPYSHPIGHGSTGDSIHRYCARDWPIDYIRCCKIPAGTPAEPSLITIAYLSVSFENGWNRFSGYGPRSDGIARMHLVLPPRPNVRHRRNVDPSPPLHYSAKHFGDRARRGVSKLGSDPLDNDIRQWLSGNTLYQDNIPSMPMRDERGHSSRSFRAPNARNNRGMSARYEKHFHPSFSDEYLPDAGLFPWDLEGAEGFASDQATLDPYDFATDTDSGTWETWDDYLDESEHPAHDPIDTWSFAQTETTSCRRCRTTISRTRRTALDCGHMICRHCLKEDFVMSTLDLTCMPPRCCSEIPWEHVEDMFDEDYREMWDAKLLKALELAKDLQSEALPHGSTCHRCQGGRRSWYHVQLECGHVWCGVCLRNAFEWSTVHPQLMPPKCCTKKHIPLAKVKSLFSNDFKKRWNKKFQEFTQPGKLFCYRVSCGQLIESEYITINERTGRSYGICPKCKRLTCKSCRSEWHLERPCAS